MVRRSPGEAPAVHNDSVHYRTASWIEVVRVHAFHAACPRKGMSYRQRARAEGFLPACSNRGVLHPRDWSGTTVGEFMDELDRWMEWFRSGRISQRLGWLTPNEYRLSLGYPV